MYNTVIHTSLTVSLSADQLLIFIVDVFLKIYCCRVYLSMAGGIILLSCIMM